MKTALLFINLFFSQDSLNTDSIKKEPLTVVKTWDMQGKELKTPHELYYVQGFNIDLMSDGTIRKRITLSK